jgi:Ca-activated chloride channel family protein
MPNLSFDLDLRWLNLLWVIAAVVAFGFYGVSQRRRALRVFAAPQLLARLAPRTGWLRPVVRLGLVAACLVLTLAAMIGPRWGEEKRTVARRNVDVMILLDVSRSMLARDIAPNRLERAKLSIRDDLLPALGGDRVGLITFAGLALVKCPLTTDYGFFRLVLDEVGVESVPRGGTLIGDAIRKAAGAFGDQLDSRKIILLITDGEDQESFPVEAAAALWADHKVPIVAVALGDEREGARIPIESKSGERYLEYKGQTVWSRANFDDLRKIAAVSNLNAFIPVGTKNFDLGAIYRDRIVPLLNAETAKETKQVRQPSHYHPFAVAALVLLLIDSFLKDGPRTAATGAGAASERREAAA